MCLKIFEQANCKHMSRGNFKCNWDKPGGDVVETLSIPL